MPEKQLAVIYARVSSKPQALGSSPEEQRRVCTQYSQKLGYEQSQTRLFNEAYSGVSKGRPVFDEALAFCEQNADSVGHFIVFDIDRLTRGGGGHYTSIKADLAKLGIELRDTKGVIQEVQYLPAVKGKIDLAHHSWAEVDPSRKTQGIEAIAAREERIKILQRTIPKEYEYALEGYYMGMPPIGLRLETDNGRKYTIVDDRSGHWVLRAFDLAARALPLSDVCDAINALGYRSKKKGKPMNIKYLPVMLRNPLYAGIMKNKWTGEECVPLKGESLVSVELWNRVNARWNEKLQQDIHGNWSIVTTKPREKRSYETDKPDVYPLKHIMVCGICGKRMKTSASTSKNGVRHPAYHCARGHKRISINAKKATQIFTELLSEKLLPPQMGDLMMEMITKLWKERIEAFSGDTGYIDIHIQQLEKEMKKIEDKILNVSIESLVSSFEQKYVAIEEQIAQAKQKKAEPNAFQLEDIEEILLLAKKIIEHPAKIVFNAPNKEVLQNISPLILSEELTVASLENGTPKWSVFMRVNANKDSLKRPWQDVSV